MSPSDERGEPLRPPLRFELMQADDYARYFLTRKAEIVFALRALLKAHSIVSAYVDDSADFMLTALLEIGDDRLVLDCATDEAMNRRALSSRRIVLLTSHDRVKIQFALPGLTRIDFEGRPAFAAPLPERLLRLQRREYFRLTASADRPLRCSIGLPMASGGVRTVDAHVIDLSAGGVAILAPPEGIDLDIDRQFDQCSLELPDAGMVATGLRIRNVFEITQRNGLRMRRCGCEFVGLRGTNLAVIERYIMRVERQRKARESGLG